MPETSTSAPSLLVRAKAFAVRHWRRFLIGVVALGALLLSVLRVRKRAPAPDDTPTVPSGPSRAARIHEQALRERLDAISDRGMQERAAAANAELEAADKLRAEEERLRREGAGASSDIAAANRYADEVSDRKVDPL